MIFMLRKEDCSRSIHDLVHISLPNCLADCLTKASANADNLITVVKTGRLLGFDIHPDFKALMEHKAFSTLYARRIRKNVCIPMMTQHAAQVRKTSDREAGQSQRDRPQRDQGVTSDATAVPHHRIYVSSGAGA